MSHKSNKRILVIDDSISIHKDFRMYLGQSVKTAACEELDAMESTLFGAKQAGERTGSRVMLGDLTIDSAYQGNEGYTKVKEARESGNPYSVAFVDVRMPPGWDGIETLKHIFRCDPDIECVLCTAYSDYSWEQIIDELGEVDRLLILKKPFEKLEVCQLAVSLVERWSHKRALARASRG